MESAGERGGASRPAPPGPGSGDTGKGEMGSGWPLCGPRDPWWPVGPAPYMRNKDSWERRGWTNPLYPTPPPPPLTPLSPPRSSATPPLPSSISELTEVPSLQSLTEPRAMRRATAPNTPPGLRSSSLGDSTSDGVEGGKRKCEPALVGTGGALWGTALPGEGRGRGREVGKEVGREGEVGRRRERGRERER